MSGGNGDEDVEIVNETVTGRYSGFGRRLSNMLSKLSAGQSVKIPASEMKNETTLRCAVSRINQGSAVKFGVVRRDDNFFVFFRDQ
jgi:hypothetical protein